MKLIGHDDGQVDLRLGVEEVVLLHRALHELCHGFQLSDHDFQEILGAQRGEVTGLLRRIAGILERLNILEGER